MLKVAYDFSCPVLVAYKLVAYKKSVSELIRCSPKTCWDIWDNFSELLTLTITKNSVGNISVSFLKGLQIWLLTKQIMSTLRWFIKKKKRISSDRHSSPKAKLDLYSLRYVNSIVFWWRYHLRFKWDFSLIRLLFHTSSNS